MMKLEDIPVMSYEQWKHKDDKILILTISDLIKEDDDNDEK